MSIIQNIELERAQFAQKMTEDVKDKKSEYKSVVSKTPMLIVTNGLAASMLFISKGSKEVLPLPAKHAYEWMKEYNRKYGIFGNKFQNDKNFVKDLVGLDSDMYRLATQEMLEYFTWLKRFSQDFK